MNNIKKYRFAANMKQSELAKELNVGQATVSNWETGYTEPDFESLRKMTELFNCSVDELIGREKTPAVEQDGERAILDITDLSPANRDKLEDYLNLLLNSQNN